MNEWFDTGYDYDDREEYYPQPREVYPGGPEYQPAPVRDIKVVRPAEGRRGAVSFIYLQQGKKVRGLALVIGRGADARIQEWRS